MKTLLPLLLLTLPAWAFTIETQQHLPTTITYSCPDELASWTQQALDSWNLALSNTLQISRVIDHATISILVVDDLGKQPSGVTIFGLTYAWGSTATIQLRRSAPYVFLVHELGHALGLGHSTDPDSVMRAILVDGYIGQDDIDGVRFVFGLSPKVWDFKCLVRRHQASVLATEKAEFVFNDGWYKVGVTRASHRLPAGVYSVSMIAGGICVKKSVTVR